MPSSITGSIISERKRAFLKKTSSFLDRTLLLIGPKARKSGRQKVQIVEQVKRGKKLKIDKSPLKSRLKI